MSLGLRGLYGRIESRPWTQKAVALGLLLLLIGILSSTPGHGGSGTAELRGYVLNWGHQPMYGLTAVLIAALLRLRLPGSSWRQWALVVLLTLALGVIDEINQAHVPERDSSLLDLGSDTLGAIFALVAAGWTQRRVGPVLEAGPVIFCLGLSLAYNCLPAFLPNVPLTLLIP